MVEKPVAPVGAEVWVLVIEHRHGTNTYVFQTKEGAYAGLAGYCDEWWHHEQARTGADDDFEPAVPEDNDELIRRYFELADDESYCIDVATVEE